MDIVQESPKTPPDGYDPPYVSEEELNNTKGMTIKQVRDYAEHYYQGGDEAKKRGRRMVWKTRPELVKMILIKQKQPLERNVSDSSATSDSTTLGKRLSIDDNNDRNIKKGKTNPTIDGGAGVELEDNSDFTLFDLLGGGKKKRKKRTRKRKRSRRSKKKDVEKVETKQKRRKEQEEEKRK